MPTEIKVSDVFVEVPEKVGSSCRVPTEKEKRVGTILKGEIAAKRMAFENAESELKRVQARCKHILRVDEDGFMYDIRTCWVCGANLGLI